MIEVHGGVEVLGHGRETRFVCLPSGCCGNQHHETMSVCGGDQTRVLFRHTIVHMSMIIQGMLRLNSYQKS